MEPSSISRRSIPALHHSQDDCSTVCTICQVLFNYCSTSSVTVTPNTRSTVPVSVGMQQNPHSVHSSSKTSSAQRRWSLLTVATVLLQFFIALIQDVGESCTCFSINVSIFQQKCERSGGRLTQSKVKFHRPGFIIYDCPVFVCVSRHYAPLNKQSLSCSSLIRSWWRVPCGNDSSASIINPAWAM